MTISAHDSLVLLALLVGGARRCSCWRRSCGSRTRSCSCSAVSASASSRACRTSSCNPEIVLVGFLPPLLYSAAFFTSLRDLRTNARAISLLSVGLVLATMLTVAAVAHTIDRRAVVAGLLRDRRDRRADRRGRGDRDRLAARPAAPARDADRGREPDQRRDRARRLRVRRGRGRRPAASRSGTRPGASSSTSSAASRSGSRSAFVIRQVRRRLDHSPTEIAIALLSGYFAYLPAEAAGVSAVLAVVTVGIYVGWYTPELTTVPDATPGRRGLGDPHVPAQRAAVRARRAAAAADPRLAAGPLDRLADRRRRDRRRGGDRHAARLDLSRPPTSRAGRRSASASAIRTRPWQYPTLIGWAGLRGAVSLAAALALPLTIDYGRALSAALLRHLPRVLRDPRDARLAGPDAARP